MPIHFENKQRIVLRLLKSSRIAVPYGASSKVPYAPDDRHDTKIPNFVFKGATPFAGSMKRETELSPVSLHVQPKGGAINIPSESRKDGRFLPLRSSIRDAYQKKQQLSKTLFPKQKVSIANKAMLTFCFRTNKKERGML